MQHCVDCHFLVKAVALPDRADVVTVLVSQAERDSAKHNDFSWIKSHSEVRCHFTVWDEGVDFDRANRRDVIVVAERNGQCFYRRYNPGMLLPAAKLLQEREARHLLESRERRLAIAGLLVAATALVADVAIEIAKALHAWPFTH